MARAVAACHLGRAGLAPIQADGIGGPCRHANPARASASRRVSGLVYQNLRQHRRVAGDLESGNNRRAAP